MSTAIGEPRFGAQDDFAIGVEEELILVDSRSRALSHTGVEVLAHMDVTAADGFAHPDTYSALIELASPVARNAGEGVAALDALRARVRAAGGTAIGAGIHPDGAFGDAVHVDEPRYQRVVDQLRGLVGRTPTCALHVHVGMPDAATAIRGAMDSQSALWSAAGLAALVHGLAAAEAQDGRDAWLPREVLMEASFTAARDGLGARLPMDGALRPAPEVARAALERARPHAAELGSADALAGIERILAEGNGADRQRAAHARGGMAALLDLLVAETSEPYE